MFEEPSAENDDGGLGQASDRPPGLALVALDEPELLKRDPIFVVVVVFAVEQAELR